MGHLRRLCESKQAFDTPRRIECDSTHFLPEDDLLEEENCIDNFSPNVDNSPHEQNLRVPETLDGDSERIPDAFQANADTSEPDDRAIDAALLTGLEANRGRPNLKPRKSQRKTKPKR